MNEVFLRTFGGLSIKGYVRHLFFGFIVFAVFFFQALGSEREVPIQALLFGVVCTFLYPYSRYVYERVVGFILGKNAVFANILVFGLAKAFTIAMCWAFAIFVAPIGLLWLYFSGSEQSAS